MKVGYEREIMMKWSVLSRWSIWIVWSVWVVWNSGGIWSGVESQAIFDCPRYVGASDTALIDAFSTCQSLGQCNSIPLINCLRNQLFPTIISNATLFCLSAYSEPPSCNSVNALIACCTSCDSLNDTASIGSVAISSANIVFDFFPCSSDSLRDLNTTFGKTGLCMQYDPTNPGSRNCTSNFATLSKAIECCGVQCNDGCTPGTRMGIFQDVECTLDECSTCSPLTSTCTIPPPIAPPISPPISPPPIQPPILPPPLQPPAPPPITPPSPPPNCDLSIGFGVFFCTLNQTVCETSLGECFISLNFSGGLLNTCFLQALNTTGIPPNNCTDTVPLLNQARLDCCGIPLPPTTPPPFSLPPLLPPETLSPPAQEIPPILPPVSSPILPPTQQVPPSEILPPNQILPPDQVMPSPQQPPQEQPPQEEQPPQQEGPPQQESPVEQSPMEQPPGVEPPAEESPLFSPPLPLSPIPPPQQLSPISPPQQQQPPEEQPPQQEQPPETEPPGEEPPGVEPEPPGMQPPEEGPPGEAPPEQESPVSPPIPSPVQSPSPFISCCSRRKRRDIL